MNKEHIIKLMDEIDKIELGSIIEITRDNEIHKYKVKYDNVFEDIELISLEEKNTVWGSCGETIEEIKQDLLCGLIRNNYQYIKVLNTPLKVKYKNWQGEIGIRTIIPEKVWYGSTEYHKEDQWLMDVWDVDKDTERTYAMMDIIEFIKDGE